MSLPVVQSCPVWEPVTPDDAQDFTRWKTNKQLTNSLYVGNAGDVTVVSASGIAVTFPNVQAAQFLPVQARRVNASTTTASGIVALYTT